MSQSTSVRWGQVLLGAFLLELTLFAVLVPILILGGVPLGESAGGPSQTPAIVLVAVAVGCALFGFLFGVWIARRVPGRFVLHGALLGAAATVLYLAIASIPPGSIPAAIALYGPFLFYLNNALRIGAAMAGAAYGAQRVRERT